ncbi:NADH-quinone oxidoreductase subunit L [Pelagivirga sediminicola]|uniref:NADH-quinone oxidoreductase subunit N n=1 Tax=Pelagivirga sediminicola TaxID=2170575 RepID=A0A2T7G3C2_9RHOB|nr:NADH-quinone oxidoreductase subunit N [Pelagivirga sediminicola]PVA08906.1 NADH-quinone oxidoreductase subunit L [Pelagivirga sediminicola]
MPVADLGPEIALIAGAIAALLLAMVLPQRRLGWCLAPALAALAVAALWAFAQADAARLTFSGTWALDGVTFWARGMIVAATALCLILAPRWFEADRRHGEFYTMTLFSALGAIAMAGAADLLQLVMAVLLSSVTGYVLAAWHRDWALSVEAGMKYFLIGALANALLVIGVILVMGMAGTSDYAALEGAEVSSPLALTGLALIVSGLAFKLGAVPGHAWVPDVAEGAPVPAAAFLTVVPKIGAALALYRLVHLFPDAEMLRPLIAALSVLTMTLGNLAALWQEDARRLIGWSSVSQSGYALMAVAVADLAPHALPALIWFLAAYALANLTAFAVIAHLRGRTALEDYKGLARTQPAMAATLILAFLSLVGIPPLIGFVGKLGLFMVTIDGGYAWLAIAAMLNTVVSLFYYVRVIAPMYFAAPQGDAPATLGVPSGAVAVVAAAGLVALGLLSGPFLAEAFGEVALP